jgi:hypothetical protein
LIKDFCEKTDVRMRMKRNHCKLLGKRPYIKGLGRRNWEKIVKVGEKVAKFGIS